MKNIFKRLASAGIAGTILLLSVPLFIPISAAPGLAYPVLESGVQYYQTTFPSGLRYSKGWYGTFTFAPSASEIILFDDDYSKEWGIAIFSMPIGVAPAGMQGGTSLEPITRAEADSIIKSYSLDESVKPFDTEILEVMEDNHFFNGVWAGKKLEQKWLGYSSVIPPPDQLTAVQQEYIETTAGKDIKEVDLARFDPDRFWVGDGGNWSDDVNHWSAASGGAPNASLPTNADNVYFDANSFSSGSQTVNMDELGFVLDMDWTGATNNPTISGADGMRVYGNATFIAAMTASFAYMYCYGTPTILTTNGLTLGMNIVAAYIGGDITLADDFNSTGSLRLRRGTLDLANFDVTVTDFDDFGDSIARTLILGSSTIISTRFSWPSANLTLPANTATIKVIGTGLFEGGGYSWPDVELNGTAHTISGSNTFTGLTFLDSATQTITFTDGTTQTITTPVLSGTAGNVHTLQGSGVGGWSITKAGGGTVLLDYMSISRSTAGPTDWYAGGNSTDGGNNTNWVFNDQPLTITTQAASNENLNGTLGALVGTHYTSTWMEYGLTTAYGSTTPIVVRTTTGAFEIPYPDDFVNGRTYQFRFVGSNDSGIYNGNNQAVDFSGAGYLLLRAVLTVAIALVTLLFVIRFSGNPVLMLTQGVIGIMAIVIIQNVIG